jgi:hypothetical protein
VLQQRGEVRGLHDIKTHDTHDWPGNDNHVGCGNEERSFRRESESAAPV